MSYHTQQPCKIALNEEIHWYLQDLARMPVHSPKAEQEAVQQIAADPHSKEADDARKLLIEANLRLVVRLARRYQPCGPELADLVQEGNLALIKAAQHFHPQGCQRFKPFATQYVCRVLSRVVEEHLRERHLLEPDRESIRPLRAQVLKALAHHAIDEQALVLDLPEERFVSLDVSLEERDTDASLPDDCFSAHAYYREETDPEEVALVQERRDQVSAACLRALTPREQLVLTRRYAAGIPQTLEEVGKVLKVTRQRVLQLEERGIRKMRHPRICRMLYSLL